MKSNTHRILAIGVLGVFAGLAAGSPKPVDEDRIQLRAEDGQVVAVIISEDGETTEIVASLIEIVSGDEVTASLTVLGDGSVAITPPTAAAPRVRIGLTTEQVPLPVAKQLTIDAEQAVMVSNVTLGLAAEKAGLRAYDVIVKLDGTAPVTQQTLRRRVAECEPGEPITLRVIRAGESREIRVFAERAVDTSVIIDPAKISIQALVTAPTIKVGVPSVSVRAPLVETLVYDETAVRVGVPILSDIPILNRFYAPTTLVDVSVNDGSIKSQLRAELATLKEQVARIEAIISQIESE